MRMKSLILFIALLASICAIAENNNFKADVTVSSTTINLTDVLNVRAVLSFPDSYHPNIDSIQSGLLTYNGLHEPPFYLVGKEVGPITKANGNSSQTITFAVAPQMPGQHILSLLMVRFDPNSPGSPVTIPSELFDITVTATPSFFSMESALLPPLPLSQTLPINISIENQRAFQNNPAAISHAKKITIDALEQRSFPWGFFVSAIALLIAVVLIRSSTGNDEVGQHDTVSYEQLKQESIDQLQKVLVNTPKTNENANAYLLRLDSSLRNYLDTTYRISTASSTALELAKKTQMITSIKPHVRTELTRIFQETDQIKFAKKQATTNDADGAADTVNKLLS